MVSAVAHVPVFPIVLLYALSSGYPWSLHLLPVRVLDTPHWRRGDRPLRIDLTPDGRALFGTGRPALTVRFVNGPVVAPTGSPPGYATLARYAEEVVHPDGVPGLMVGSAAAVLAPYRAGRVLAIGPHLEETPGLEPLLAHAAGTAAGAAAG